ncbi:MAG TPA: ATP-binding cassette domain-containing protein [Firmicutes bacterium]|nr:ATP-binding cassette domain-containing protein [Bacillota bacterium]
MIELKDISVSFGKGESRFHAVKDVSLQINTGEIFGIVGPSGAGKSTLVRVMNLLQQPTQGQILIDGEDITQAKGAKLRQIRKNMGMIFQHFNLISGATVFENVAFALTANGYPKEKQRARVEELLKMVGLSEKIDVYPASLSGGQKQRVAIARALANTPKILLCDEATSALDLESTEEVLSILHRIKENSNITIVFITHDLDAAKKLFDRIAVMSEGQIVEVNDTYSIFSNPVHPVTQMLVNRNFELDVPDFVADAVQADEELYKIYYVGQRAYDPVINEVAKRYDVEVSILHGKIDYIHRQALGILVVKVKGQDAVRQAAVAYMKEHVYRLEKLK